MTETCSSKDRVQLKGLCSTVSICREVDSERTDVFGVSSMYEVYFAGVPAGFVSDVRHKTLIWRYHPTVHHAVVC